MGLSFVDSDQVIEQQLGCTIRDFFEREGELSFRDVEQSVIDTLTLGPNVVLATGGGSVLRPQNRLHLRERSQVVYLSALPDELFRRLKNDLSRPLLQVADPLNRLRELYDTRNPMYLEAAHFVIQTGRPSVATLVNMISMQLELSGIYPVA
jgi:shikimate kinase